MRQSKATSLLTWFFAFLWLAGLPLGLPAGAQTPASVALVTSVDGFGMTVSDMDRSVAFYTGVLSFKKVSDVEVNGDSYERLTGVFGLRMRVVRLKLGDEILELTQYRTPRGRPVPPDSRSNDRWFQHIAIIVSDMDKAYAVLRAHKVEYVSPSPQRLPEWNKEAGGIQAFYFHDPDAHPLEILQFPPNKGEAKWHNPGLPLFAGIDHTAIVVRDTDASLKFYRGTLGMKIAGESDNYGTEQEHLNNVFGARLRITSLRAANGPGIELLEYRTPRNGRPMPQDARANDLFHWHTLLTTRRERLQSVLREAFRSISPDLITLPDAALGFGAGQMVSDPDGHVLELIIK